MINGFTTSKFRKYKTFRIHDIDVIQESLINFIMTVKGERPNMPEYGTKIPLLAFSPIDSVTLNVIKEEIHNAIRAEPRAELIDYAVMHENHKLKIIVDLKVKYTGEIFQLNFSVN